LDEELWKLGVPAKTKHNEVAPSQHELAPVFETANVAVDHNQLTMEVMKKVADKRGFACLLHEKPFAGVNGSGKHNNWSIQTNTGINLLNPGKHPAENKEFLLFLMAVISAVDEYSDILRVSVASAGNDHRLGANEAPPAIVSVFVGDELQAILDSIEQGKKFTEIGKTQMEMGAEVLPHIQKDTTDRNRTSPFAFTGNKFEFRMPGSSISVANANIVLNTAVAEALERIYECLKDVSKEELSAKIEELLKKLLSEHKKVVFNGNGYTDAWVEEAEKRGLDNLKSLPDAMPRWISDKSVELFTKHKIFTKEEIFSRYEILLENYSKTLHIESLTLQEMVRKDFFDGLIAYQSDVLCEAEKKKSLLPDSPCVLESNIASKLDVLSGKILRSLEKLSEDTKAAEENSDALSCAKFYQETVLSDMEVLRSYVDVAEGMIPDSYIPYPTYGELLFSLR
nr:glutamine synthetase [Lachnospiraceae bacterium]